jgi:hypothetical protein
MTLQSGCLTVAGAASALALAIGPDVAAAQCPATLHSGVAVGSMTVSGSTICTVDMSEYASHCSSGSTLYYVSAPVGGNPICEESFATAINDAKRFFGTYALPLQINIDTGLYDFSNEGTTGASGTLSLSGAIQISGVTVPDSATGCQTGTSTSSFTGTMQLSGYPCLIISGVGSSSTTLTTNDYFQTFYATSMSHLVVENMTLLRRNGYNGDSSYLGTGSSNGAYALSTTQGTLVSTGTISISNGGGTPYTYQTLTLDITPSSLATPSDVYSSHCWKLTGYSNCGTSTPADTTIQNAIYLRAYTNYTSPSTPSLVLSTSGTKTNAGFNGQNAWGFPQDPHTHTFMADSSGNVILEPPQQVVGYPNRWTLVMSDSTRPVPTAYSDSTGAGQNLVCMKADQGDFFYIIDLNASAPTGTDIILNNITMLGTARSKFRGVTARSSTGTFSLGVQVYNLTIARNPAVTTQTGATPCFSTQSGGMQIGDSNDGSITGNVVFGLTADATGDDTVAFFNDNSTSGTVTQSSVLESEISNSLARDVVLTNSPYVYVDSNTQSYITTYGNCDPLVLGNNTTWGTSNCPVTYVP